MIFEGNLGSAWEEPGLREHGGRRVNWWVWGPGGRTEDYRRGAAGNRHSLAAARRTAAMLKGLALLLRELLLRELLLRGLLL